MNLFTITRFTRQKALQISSFYSHDLFTRRIWLKIMLASSIHPSIHPSIHQSIKGCIIRLQEQITGLLEQLKEEQRLRYASIIVWWKAAINVLFFSYFSPLRHFICINFCLLYVFLMWKGRHKLELLDRSGVGILLYKE